MSNELMKAVESGDNLAILKAHRRMIAKDLSDVEIEDTDRLKLSGILLSIQKEIIKIEGAYYSEEAKKQKDAAKFLESLPKLGGGEDD